MVSTEASTYEPVLLKVVRSNDDVVAELLVSPLKPLRNLKTQIAGLEGTAIDNQALFFQGDTGVYRLIDDNTSLAGMGMTGGMATMVLVTLQPLLAGRLASTDLQRLLEDDAAMEQAIDGFKENPQYTPEEVIEILSALARTLLPTQLNAADELAAELLLDPELACNNPEFCPQRHHGDVRSKELARFVHAIRAAIVLIQKRLCDIDSLPLSSEEHRNESSSPSPITDTFDVCDRRGEIAEASSGEAHVRALTTKTAVVSRPPEVGVENCPEQLIGAGKELLEILHRQWNTTQCLAKTYQKQTGMLTSKTRVFSNLFRIAKSVKTRK
jgi:hypothetical protein